MKITVECIHEMSRPGSFCGGASLSCRIDGEGVTDSFRLPGESVFVYDLLGFYQKMSLCRAYDCALEVASFKAVDLFTNHSLSVRGVYRERAPHRYRGECGDLSERACIEAGDGILYISPLNNSLRGRVRDGETVELIPEEALRLLAVSFL